jgi:hypothetical protein
MSKGELWKGVAISAIIGVTFGVIAYYIISYALQMVGVFGEAMGIDARSREIYAEVHKWVHIFSAACGLAIGWFHHQGNKALRRFALVAILTCGGYGILNMYGFASTNRVSVAAAKDATRAGAERSYQAARADLMGQIDWLQKTAIQEDGAERRRLLKEVDDKRKELSSLKPPVATAETVISDTQSWTLGKLTNTDPTLWMVGLPLVLAVLVFLGESFSCIVVGHMAAGIVGMFAAYREGNKTTVAGSPEGSGGKDKSTVALRGENVVDLPTKVAAPPQLQAAPEPVPTVSSEALRVAAPAPKTVSLSLEPKEYASVEEFLAANPSVSKQKDIAAGMKVSEGKVSRDIKRLKGRGKVKADRNGRSIAVTYTPRRNGGLHALA